MPLRSLLLVTGLLGLLTACADAQQDGAPPEPQAGPTAAPASTAVETPEPPAAEVAAPTVACPSLDFDTFLPAFANDDAIRSRFTHQPLETVVRTHRASKAASPYPQHEGMSIETDSNPQAHEVFAYRFDADLRKYEHVGMPLEPLVGAFKADPEWAFDFDVTQGSPESIEIATGPEPERKAFVFAREADCWYFVRAYDFGD